MLVRTSKHKRHEHIVYVAEDIINDGLRGITTEASPQKHTHQVIYTPETKLITLGPGGPDNHTHEIGDEIEETPGPDPLKSENLDDHEKAALVRKRWLYSKELEKDYRTKAAESERVVRGEHWTPAERGKNNKEQRPSLVINEVEGKIDLLSGYHRQNRLDIKFYPTEGGDGKVADMLTAITKNVLSTNHFIHEENLFFDDMIITGRAFFDVYMDFDKNINGDIVVEWLPWDSVYLGEHDKYDLTDCEMATKSKWLSWGVVKERWPDKKEEITKDLDKYVMSEHDEGGSTRQHADDEYDHDSPVTKLGEDFIDIDKKLYRVFSSYSKVYQRVQVVMNARDDFFFNGAGLDEKDMAALKTIPALTFIPRVVTQTRVTLTAGGVVLDDRIDDDLDGEFSIVVGYAKKRGKYVWGKVEGVKDAQMELDKRHSQAIDFVNRANAGGWFYSQDTFARPSDRKKFLGDVSKPGFTVKVADMKHKPERAENARFPREIVELELLSREQIERIMNVSGEMSGRGEKNQSGIAMKENKKAGLIGNEFLFDNLRISKRQLGLKIVTYLRKYYPAKRLSRILNNQIEIEPTIKIGGRSVGENPEVVPGQAGLPGLPEQSGLPEQPELPEQQEQSEERYTLEELQAMLDNDDLTRYDVNVGEGDYNVTTRLANFAIWMEYARNNPGVVPPAFMVELSDLPNKEEALKQFAEQQKMLQDEEKAKQETEIVKTEIAAQSKQQGAGGGPLQ
jgi:hypothetical protein